MTDTDRDTPDLLDTPIMPTGSGVADLEVARELDALAEDGPLTEETDAITDVEAAPIVDEPAQRESEGHPS